MVGRIVHSALAVRAVVIACGSDCSLDGRRKESGGRLWTVVVLTLCAMGGGNRKRTSLKNQIKKTLTGLFLRSSL